MHPVQPTQEFVPFGEKVLAKQITIDPMSRRILGTSTGFGLRNSSAECFVGTADGAFRAREIRRLYLKEDGTQKPSTM